LGRKASPKRESPRQCWSDFAVFPDQLGCVPRHRLHQWLELAGSECYEGFGGTVECNERDGAQGRSVKIEPWEAVFAEVSTLDGFMMGPTLIIIFRAEQPTYRLSSYNCRFYIDFGTAMSI
jgi:hypothetical protein